MTARDTEIDILRGAATREQVRRVGHNPDSPSGKRLVQWANAQPAVPTEAELAAKSSEWNLEVQTPAQDPATVEQRIAEARAAGDWETASRLQHAVDRVRQAPAVPEMTADETAAIREARERAENAETPQERIDAWSEASNLQRAAERRMRGVGSQAPPEPYPVQPTGGLGDSQRALLEDEDKSLTDRLAAAQEAGDYVVSSLLQTRIEREARGKVRA